MPGTLYCQRESEIKNASTKTSLLLRFNTGVDNDISITGKVFHNLTTLMK